MTSQIATMLAEPRLPTTPCGRCVAGEFADDDSDGIAYIARPGLTRAHIERPEGSWGQGDGYQALGWMTREGPYTYCGMPMTGTWLPVEALNAGR